MAAEPLGCGRLELDILQSAKYTLNIKDLVQKNVKHPLILFNIDYMLK